MPQLKCIWDSFEVSLNENRKFIIVAAKRAPNGVWPPHLQPELCGGRIADHLSLPMEPLQDGRNAGKINPHLTYYARGRKEQHRSIDLVDPTTGKAFTARMEDRLLAHADRLYLRVTLDELAAGGYLLSRGTTQMKAEIEQKIEARAKVRLPQAIEAFEQTPDAYCEWVYPLDLRPEEFKGSGDLLQVHRELDDGTFEIWGSLCRYDWQPPDEWVVIPRKAMHEAFFETAMEMLPVFVRYTRIALREMQADVPRDFIERLFSDDILRPSLGEFFGWPEGGSAAR